MPCAGVLCNTMRHGTREATARGREALVLPSEEHRAADGPENLEAVCRRLVLITDARCERGPRAVGSGSAGFPSLDLL